MRRSQYSQITSVADVTGYTTPRKSEKLLERPWGRQACKKGPPQKATPRFCLKGLCETHALSGPWGPLCEPCEVLVQTLCGLCADLVRTLSGPCADLEGQNADLVRTLCVPCMDLAHTLRGPWADLERPMDCPERTLCGPGADLGPTLHKPRADLERTQCGYPQARIASADAHVLSNQIDHTAQCKITWFCFRTTHVEAGSIPARTKCCLLTLTANA
jgi:hypothetical protein